MAPIEASGNSNAAAALEAFRSRAFNRAAPSDGLIAPTTAARPEAATRKLYGSSAAPVQADSPSLRTLPAQEPPASQKTHFSSLPDHINVDEIHQIAQRSGYVGLTQSAIQRAYLNGESLLTDIRA